MHLRRRRTGNDHVCAWKSAAGGRWGKAGNGDPFYERQKPEGKRLSETAGAGGPVFQIWEVRRGVWRFAVGAPEGRDTEHQKRSALCQKGTAHRGMWSADTGRGTGASGSGHYHGGGNALYSERKDRGNAGGSHRDQTAWFDWQAGGWSVPDWSMLSLRAGQF